MEWWLKYFWTSIRSTPASMKRLEFADVGYLLVSGQVTLAGPNDSLLCNEEVGGLLLGG